jgi:peptide-methionine (S)-S-oxide reductase
VSDALFQEAVAAIDSGDVAALQRLLDEHPGLLSERLDVPGAWLRERVGNALDGFFQRPYLLWFVAEDPVRNGTLPPNIVDVTRTIIAAARRARVEALQEQLDYALRLVSWSGVARDAGVQIPLIDELIDAGASPDGNPDNALVNGHVAAAEHLLRRGATLTLPTALCVGRGDDVRRLWPAASDGARQFAFVLAALNGRAEGLRLAIELGVDLNRPSADLYAHAPALHHAVCSGSLEAVQVLVAAGADLTVRDTLWDGTPLDWARYYQNEREGDERGERYAAIVEYLGRRG